MSLIKWIKSAYGSPKIRMDLILDGVDLMAANIAPRVYSNEELQLITKQFADSLKKYAGLPKDNMTS